MLRKKSPKIINYIASAETELTRMDTRRPAAAAAAAAAAAEAVAAVAAAAVEAVVLP